MSISTLLSWCISFYHGHPPPIHSLHFHIQPFLWRIAGKATLWRVNEMLGIGWLPHQPSHACWWYLNCSIWKGVCDCHSISYPRECLVPTPHKPDHLVCQPQASRCHPWCWSLGNAEQSILPSVRCHSTSSSPSSWSLTGVFCTLHMSPTCSRASSVA